MREYQVSYRVVVDEFAEPIMYGIAAENHSRVQWLSTNYQEVDRLARTCNRGGLSYLHFCDVIEDFRRA